MASPMVETIREGTEVFEICTVELFPLRLVNGYVNLSVL